MFIDERFASLVTRCKHDKVAVLELLMKNDSEQGSNASSSNSGSCVWLTSDWRIDPSLTRSPIDGHGVRRDNKEEKLKNGTCDDRYGMPRRTGMKQNMV